MYGTLGYIDSGRRPAQRDAGFLGANTNPSRRDMYGAARRVDAGAPTVPMASAMGSNTLALLERRCVFLEEQDKRRVAEIADLRAKLAESRPEGVRATVLKPTVQRAVLEGEDAPTADEPVVGGTEVDLQYPMKRVSNGRATQIWMRRRIVDPRLATVSYTWILLFQEEDAVADEVFVGEFR